MKITIKIFTYNSKILIFTMVGVFLFIFSSCQKSKNGGTTTGNPIVLSMTGSSNSKTISKNSFFQNLLSIVLPKVNALPPPTSLVDATNLVVNLTNSWIVIKEIEFKSNEVADSSEVDGAEISLPGPYVIDLFSTTPSSIGNTNIYLTNIRRIKMKLSKSDSSIIDSTMPQQLNGQSIYLAGSVNGNSFTFTTSEEVEYEIAGPSGISTSESTSNLLISINIANLIRKIDLSQITNGSQISESNKIPTGSNPCPLIDLSAQDIYTCFKLGLKTEANLGKDSDGSGEIESDEESLEN